MSWVIMKQNKLVTAVTGLLGVGMFGLQATAGGGTIVVDSFNDVPEAGLTTLREATEQINNNPDLSLEIRFDQTIFSVPRTIELTAGELMLTSTTSIVGPGADLLTIDGQGLSRVLNIDDDSNTTLHVGISGITFTGGNGQSASASDSQNNRGGCLFTNESLTLRDSVVTGCDAAVDGGGIWSRHGQLTLIDSEISHNNAAFKGGGVYSRGVPAKINNSTISGNSIGGRGAGIFLNDGGEINNATITANTSRDGRSAGIHLESQKELTAVNSTLFNNAGVGLIAENGSKLFISNSVIAGHVDGDCALTSIDPESMNLNNLDSDGSCNSHASDHITVADVRLEPLTHFGGPTATLRPLADSPVIDRGDNASCLNQDQRGETRPQDGDGDQDAVCDIGAVELSLNEQVPKEVIFTDSFDQFICPLAGQSPDPNRGCRSGKTHTNDKQYNNYKQEFYHEKNDPIHGSYGRLFRGHSQRRFR